MNLLQITSNKMTVRWASGLVWVFLLAWVLLLVPVHILRADPTQQPTPIEDPVPAEPVAPNQGPPDETVAPSPDLVVDAEPADAVATPNISTNINSSTSSNSTSKNASKNASNQGQWAAGSLSALNQDHLEHSFSLKNSGKTSITISQLQTSCDCTSAVATTGKGPAVLPLQLASGQAMTIQVSVDLAKVAPGPLSKAVLVYTPGNPRPIATLQVSGTLRPSLSLSPALLDFGQVPGQGGQALTVTATWDERLTPGGTLPQLASTNPDITVTPQPETVALPSKTHGPSPFLHRGIRVRTYRVAVSPSAALGPVSGLLSFRVPSAATHPTILAQTIFAQPTVLLLGQVQGEVGAQPQALMFGSVKLGQPASREIVLTGKSTESLKNLSVSTASPWLDAHLSPATPVFVGGQLQPSSQVLDVSLHPDAPAGLLTSTLKIILANGQHLRVPVTANVGSAF